MDASHQNETNVNKTLANLINQVMHGRKTRAESTRMIAGKDNAGLKPDIVIIAKGRSPVVIEAKYMHVPEIQVQDQAREHVGKCIHKQTHPIEAAIAVRYPASLAQADDIESALESCQLSYCAVYPNGGRFPKTSWIKGSVCDLADLIQLGRVGAGGACCR